MPKIINFINQYKYLLFIGFYLLLRIYLLNINSAEWGDSYRILRATTYLESGLYPEDEKRPPLFSAFLLLKVSESYLVSSRILMLVISLITIFVFYLLLSSIDWKLTETQKFLSLLLFSLNPLFLYWSIRIYADTMFLLWLLLGIYIFNVYLKNNSKILIFTLSLICIFSILTRFEGYLLVITLALGLIFQARKKFDFILFVFYLSTMYYLILLFPDFFHYKNPLSSSYVDEAGTRVLRVKEILNFFSQFIFLLGNLFSFYFIAFNYKNIISFFKKNLIILFSLILHLGLSFVWFAAVPRLFLPLIPFYSLLFVISLFEYFNKTSKIYFFNYLKTFWKKENLHYLSLVLLPITYLLGQYYLKLPFLLTSYTYIGAVMLISLVCVVLIITHFKNLLLTIIILSNVFWSLAFIGLEKDTYRILNNAILFFIENKNFTGNVLTNDISSISKYYLKDSYHFSDKLGSGKDFKDEILKKNIKYVIVTNEHNPDLSFTPSKHPYLSVLKEFRGNINGVEFFTILSEVINN